MPRTEELFVQNILFVFEGIYESETPPQFRLLCELGCAADMRVTVGGTFYPSLEILTIYSLKILLFFNGR